MAAPMPNSVDRLSRSNLEPNINEGGPDPSPDPIFHDAIVHIVLPKQTPQQQQTNLEEIEHLLLQKFTKSIKSILTEQANPVLESITLMLEKWETLQPTSGTHNYSQFLANFLTELRRLEKGNTIPVYLRHQNSTLLIKMNMDGSISLSTFRPSLPCDIVMSNTSGAHFMEIPETTETIQNTDLLKSLSFAKQLYKLATEDVDFSLEKRGTKYIDKRDVADPKLVSDWIVGLLVPQNSSQENLNAHNKSIFRKKFRDQVSFMEASKSVNSLPFRRFGMYMAIKGTVQMKLLETFVSNEEANMVYKIIMLRILADTADELPIVDSTSIDLASQMLAKLGRRVQKLAENSNDGISTRGEVLPDFVMTMKSTCLDKVATSVERLTGKMKAIWNNAANCPNYPQITLPSHHDDKDLLHEILNLDEFIKKLNASLSQSTIQTTSVISESEVFPRYAEAESIKAINTSPLLPSSAHVWLYDTENFIKYHCDDVNITVVQLSQILSLYFEKATSQYGGDPLGKSQIYLVSLKGLEVLDKIVTRDCPLLKEYKPDVNIKLFDNLLLPFQKDMILLDHLLTYFKTREDNASYPGILQSSVVDAKTFSVCYAQNCSKMVILRDKIYIGTNVAIEQKNAEVAEKKEVCDNLLLEIHNLMDDECVCQMVRQRENESTSKYSLVQIQCKKCKLQEQLKSSRKAFGYYKLLPNNTNIQWAVIFEFLIPQFFEIFRNYLAHIKFVIWGDKIFNGGENYKDKLWVENTSLASYQSRHRVYPENIQLCSPTLSGWNTVQLDVLNNTKEDFIIDNGLGCAFYCSIRQDKKKPSITTDCSFQLKDTFEHEPYTESNLQVALESTNHTQNSILARQIDCHKNLVLEEFIAFGSIRAGHRIQLRNLYSAIHSGSLSLERESVLALILQTIWQAGPGENGRVSHLDFAGESTLFAEEFLEMLDRHLTANKENYSSSLTTLVAVIITRRIADLNIPLQDKCYGLLRSWRTILSAWMTKIETAIDQPEAALVHGGVPSLRKNLLEIVLCSMFSYGVAGSEDAFAVIRDEDDVVYWLQTLYQWNQLEEQPVPTSNFFKILQNFLKTIPLRLNLERQILDENDLAVNSLKTFISQRWTRTKECTFQNISLPYKTRNRGSLVLLEYLEKQRITQQFTFDFIRGQFLINGYCKSNLPSEVKDHKLFQLYFKDATNLKIHREDIRLARTVVPFYGRHYEFHQTGETLIIQEIQDDDTNRKLVLLDSEIFYNVLSAYFTENFAHWLDTTNSCVYFRRIDMLEDHSYCYVLQRIFSNQKSSWTLFDTKTQSYVLSIRLSGFKHVTKSLERLELDDNIIVTFHQDSSTTTATLRRYNLRFIINWKSDKPEKFLESVEYPSYNVSCNQYEVKTFIGLCQGLLLENGEKRLILMPHSSIKYLTGQHHQHCSIQLSVNLRQPPCFVYEVDDVLNRLKAHNSKPAWLYLAFLHAVTSSSFFPDPFTGITGTEMAVNILQSACVWSCSPYDEESLSTLNFIKDLSPTRKWYGHDTMKKKPVEDKGSMEITMWPYGLPSMVAYDGYYIIVNKLIEESEKLAMLHSTSEPMEIDSQDNLSELLQIRGYQRSLPYYTSSAALEYYTSLPNSHITLISQSVENSCLSLRSTSAELNIFNMQFMSLASLNKSMEQLKANRYFNKNNLANFLISRNPLDKNCPPVSLDYIGAFQDLLKLDFRFNWLRLYTMATSCKTPEDFHFYGIILSAAAYRGAWFEQLVNLHCISLLSVRNGNHTFPSVPFYLCSTSNRESTHYSCPAENNYEASIVYNILYRNAKLFIPEAPTRPSVHGITNLEFQEQWNQYINDLGEYQTRKSAYEQQIKASCSSLNVYFNTFWPVQNIPASSISNMLENHNFKSALVIKELNHNLEFWHRNHIFKIFVDEVQAKLNKIWDSLDIIGTGNQFSLPLPLQQASTIVSGEQVDAIKKMSKPLKDFLDVSKAEKLEECHSIFQFGHLEAIRNVNVFMAQRNLCKEKAQEIEDNLAQMLTSTISSKIYFETGITPRLSPISVLKHLTLKNGEQDGSNILFSYAGALGVLWTHIKRLNRCIRNEADIQREKDNLGHSNWSPKSHPEWLLLELELDIMIRPIQVEVANQMIKMPSGKNGVTQLNMGEGKTSVIVPMLCATLAQKNSQLCRVTVISSMFKMNLRSLTFSIGGLLSKRVYSVPCRRDMKIDEDCLDKIQQAYRECLNNEGVVLTLPEYRLSFRLLAYDNMYKKEWALGKKMLDVENFLRNYARDVLDESDELFSVKYQLVYTIGAQVSVDGGDLRWLECQKILDSIPKIGEILFRKYGAGMVEFHENLKQTSPHKFSTFRLLGNKDCLKEFQNLVAESILSNLWISDNDKQIVKRFLVEDKVDRKEHDYVMKELFSNHSPDILQRILLYSGYLRRDILGLALTKRWRVEYGANPKPEPKSNISRLMAIPFRAKDVAADKTEFGHPDLAIILTHLSYYYSGLSNKQLQDVFDILKGKQSPEAIFTQWISKIPIVPDGLKRYHSLNMKDAHQKAKLFQMLRQHKMVVNFWLSHSVFPREAKQFPGKLVMTAWDLCYERQRLAVTGFSGTNDSYQLLPLEITQQDLEQLKNTNEYMRKTLLRTENEMNHKGFPMGVTCQQILETMKEDNLTVLIDAGALMLECSNEQVASLWLKTDPNIEAAVYFNEKNELLVKSRGDEKSGQDTLFEVCPYQGRLEKCGVFLDDQHTRGTDLKFPVGSKACVTVATRMKRDKLIQACMRMRKLGQGHSVTFYLSHEARDKVGGNEITTKGVLNWVCKNTEESNQDGLVHWALAGRNYAQRLAAEDHFHFPNYLKPYESRREDGPGLETRLAILADQCVDDEVVKLEEMYGQYTEMEFLTELVQKWFNNTKYQLRQKAGKIHISTRILRNVDKIREKVADQNLEMVPDKMNLTTKTGSTMEEEQERELEEEKEQERNIERPPRATPAVPRLHDNVKALVIHGGKIQNDGEHFLKICEIFRNTTFWDQVQPQSWKGNVFATKNFVSTIRTDNDFETDGYLRPVRFLISIKQSPSMEQWLAISPFEANELLPIFRSTENTKCKLHMFCARCSEKQDLLINNHRLRLPPALNLVDDNNIIPGPELTSLLLASGNLYFTSMQEQMAFTAYLGLFPMPWWCEEERLAFEKGEITKSGFWLPQFLPSSSSNEQIRFEEDPTGLVKKILTCRHSSLSDMTHLMQILNEKQYVQL